jgi:Pyridoxamine 5'-phosphate oxidase
VEEPAPPRSRSQRTADTLERLRRDVDLWIASASADGEAYLVPLSYHWDGMALTIATPSASPIARNLLRAGRVRAALGQTRDVVIVEGTVEALPIGADPELEDAHARPGSTRGRSGTSTSTCGSRRRSMRGASRTSSPAAC